MATVTINPPRTPVTEGSSGIAAATLPNVCKMPGPPAPFIPTPLPNIGRSGSSPSKYSKNVRIEGKAVAIRGSSFGSQGDIASKGTGGGIVSSNTEGPTTFVGPGSLDVQIEGKNVQLLGDPMLNNCGPSGSPPNSATMTGVLQAAGGMAIIYGDDEICRKCRKEPHPIPEGKGVSRVIGQLLHRLRQMLAEQRQRIKRLEAVVRSLNAEEPKQAPLLRQISRAAGEERLELTEQLRSLQSTIAVLKAERDTLDAYFRGAALFRYDGKRSYTVGYMVGCLICRCNGKRLVTCSGAATPGFIKAASGCAGFVRVGAGFEPSPAQMQALAATGRNKWECAAPKLLDAAKGHKPAELSERTFNPLGKGPTVQFKVLDLNDRLVTTRQTFKPSEAVPSCETCQPLLGEMYCEAKC